MSSREQRQMMDYFCEVSGYHFMGREQVRATDPDEFRRLWRRNIQWLLDTIASLDREIDDYNQSLRPGYWE